MTVTFGESALSEPTLEKLFAYINGLQNRNVWNSNFKTWQSELTISNGAVITHLMHGAEADMILNELVERRTLPYRPVTTSMMFYAWYPGSSIAWHQDYAEKNSMTVYLSPEWHPDFGGWFCWRDWDGNFRRGNPVPPTECRMRLPQFNNWVMMNESEWHTTTLTSPYAKVRLSLQMFFDKP